MGKYGSFGISLLEKLTRDEHRIELGRYQVNYTNIKINSDFI